MSAVDAGVPAHVFLPGCLSHLVAFARLGDETFDLGDLAVLRLVTATDLDGVVGVDQAQQVLV